MSSLNQYVFELQASLAHLHAETRQEIVREVRGHLEDEARCLQLRGLPKGDSMSKAIEHFGSAEEIGGEMRRVYERGTWGEALLAAGATLLFTLLAEGHHILWLAFGVRIGSLYTLAAMALIFLGVSAYAWRRAFPRWTCPWLGYALLWTLYFSGERTVGPYVWPAALLLLGLLALSSVGFGPLAALARSIWRDWTLGSFVLFPATMLLSWLFFDETPFARGVPFIVGIGLLCALASAAFILARSSAARVTSLAIATLVSMTTVFLATRAEWFEPALGWLAVVIATALAYVFSPAAIVAVKSRVASR